MFFYDKYVAIIGDIVDSKKIKDRKAMQQKFKNLLTDINMKYSEDIASKFTIILGDEFQGLLKNRSHIMKIICEIEMAMTPIELRFGMVILAQISILIIHQKLMVLRIIAQEK